MPKKVLRRILTKNDKRKTAKAVIPLRFIDILVPICRDITSTCWVQSPLVLKQIFLTGNPPILYRIYVNRSHCLQAIKIPPQTSKKRSRRDFKAWQISPPKHRFFYSAGLSYLWLYKTKPTNRDFSQVHRLCV